MSICPCHPNQRMMSTEALPSVPLTRPAAPEDHIAVIRVIAVACAVSVANLFLNQPLLADMARTFGVRARTVGAVPMLSQIGYAIGLLLIVPLGDILQRRGLIMTLLGLVALS